MLVPLGFAVVIFVGLRVIDSSSDRRLGSIFFVCNTIFFFLVGVVTRSSARA